MTSIPTHPILIASHVIKFVLDLRGRGRGGREEAEAMGCSFSGLNAFYDSVSAGGDVWINENRFRILRQLGEGGFAYVYLVKEVVSDGGGLAKKKSIDPSHISGLAVDPSPVSWLHCPAS